MHDAHLAPRQCLRAPIPETSRPPKRWTVPCGRTWRVIAAALIAATDLPAIREWTQSLWGDSRLGAAQQSRNRPEYLPVRAVPGAPPKLAKADRLPERMPTDAEKRRLIDRCGIPVIRDKIRAAIRAAYPIALSWGGTNATEHAAFQCLWLRYDDAIPHARGATTASTTW